MVDWSSSFRFLRSIKSAIEEYLKKDAASIGAIDEGLSF